MVARSLVVFGLMVGLGAGAMAQGSATKVLTFAGLRAFEDDARNSDEAKVARWEAYIERTEQQLVYAKKAANYWRGANVLRLEATARAIEADPAYPFSQRVSQWQSVLDVATGEQAAYARSRVEHWRARELERRMKEAEGVESSRALKVDRIKAWVQVVEWSPKSKPGQAAAQRIQALQAQLVREAEAAEHIERLEVAAKIELWNDVLRGAPSNEQRRKAQRRIQALQP